jgi:light-harvesting complex I chlorophyll a/b binding protein 5
LLHPPTPPPTPFPTAQLGAEAGLGFPQWYDAGKVAIATSPFSFNTLLGVQFLLFAWVETKRFLDFKNPGSQGDGSFFGITDDFKGKENGYPGGLGFGGFGGWGGGVVGGGRGAC